MIKTELELKKNNRLKQVKPRVTAGDGNWHIRRDKKGLEDTDV